MLINTEKITPIILLTPDQCIKVHKISIEYIHIWFILHHEWPF